MGQTQSIDGTISISASETYAAVLLPPIIAKLRAQHPGIRVEIVVSNTASDLRRREADIAIRNFRPVEPDLIATKVAEAEARLYASPAYLARIGPLHAPHDLSRADFIDLDGSGMFMKALNQMGLGLTKKNFQVMTESYLVMWELVKRGIGIGVLDSLIGDAEPAVQRALPDLDPLIFPIWLVAHREVTTNRRIRTVFDLLKRELTRPSETRKIADSSDRTRHDASSGPIAE